MVVMRWAFSVCVIGLALAAGLAFGLGGRTRAAELLDRFDRAAPLLPAAAALPTTTPPAGAMEEPVGTAPPSPVVFEEGWAPRSGLDRRRMARPGPDRRAVSA